MLHGGSMDGGMVYIIYTRVPSHPTCVVLGVTFPPMTTPLSVTHNDVVQTIYISSHIMTQSDISIKHHNFVISNDIFQRILSPNSAKECLINYIPFLNLKFSRSPHVSQSAQTLHCITLQYYFATCTVLICAR